MPPKAKFNKEEIIAAAFGIVKRDGMDALTARALGDELGSSPRPIFTVFNSMDEVQSAVISAAKSMYAQYQDEGLNEKNPFKGSGTGYLKFAAEEPKLFQLLFMRERENVLNINTVLGEIDDYSEKIIKSIEETYGFVTKTAQEIYFHAWIYTHGIASLIATNVCKFTDEETSRMLDEVVGSVIIKFKMESRK